MSAPRERENRPWSLAINDKDAVRVRPTNETTVIAPITPDHARDPSRAESPTNSRESVSPRKLKPCTLCECAHEHARVKPSTIETPHQDDPQVDRTHTHVPTTIRIQDPKQGSKWMRRSGRVDPRIRIRIQDPRQGSKWMNGSGRVDPRIQIRIQDRVVYWS